MSFHKPQSRYAHRDPSRRQWGYTGMSAADTSLPAPRPELPETPAHLQPLVRAARTAVRRIREGRCDYQTLERNVVGPLERALVGIPSEK